MGILRRAYRVFKSDGLSAVVAGGRNKLLQVADPVYQLLKPSYKRYGVGEASAEFDMSRRRLGRYDFVNDMYSEADIIGRILSAIDEDDVFYDIGANVGIYTCLVGSKLDSGSVVAFEPVPDVYEILERNVARNGTDAELYQVALSSENGQSEMSIRGQTGHQISGSVADSIQIDTRRGDDLVAEEELETPDICKIDIEGAECVALEGLRQTITEFDCRRIFCEVHTEKINEVGGSGERVERILEESGYSIDRLGDRRENYFLDAKKATATD